ncbi:hypothetical protein B0919_03815 [Hymenobacter sp. CRA2]|nr:hypothetical protein B0919_03815 [Hymenobacter sp. CRA2]
MPNQTTLLRYGIGLLLIGCTSKNSSQLAYDYSLAVEDTNPMIGPEASLEVEMSPNASGINATLYACSRYDTLWATHPNALPRFRRVPFDTLRISLTTNQVDSIYQMARQVFALPVSLRTRDPNAPPPPPPAHDLDNFLVVRFRPYGYGGPHFECGGYEENNAAAYRLQSYLTRIKNHAPK